MRILAASLASLVAGGLSAADLPSGQDPRPGLGSEILSGPRFAVGQQRAVTIRGMLQMEVLNQGQYLSGNREVSDHRGYGNIRAELGARVRLDEQVAAHITLAYEAEAGDNTADDPTGQNRSGFTVVDDAYVELREVLGFESVGMFLGRQPVSWNLREGHGAFLYDSLANHPRVTSWDGARGSWNVVDGVDVSPFAFKTPGASNLFGAAIDWKPAKSGDSRTFLTGMATWELSAPRESVNALGANGPSQTASGEGLATFTPGTPGDRLTTYYVGADFYLGNVELFAEGAMQRGGELDGVTYAGWGLSGGFDWHAYAAQALVIGLQVDHLTGDDDPTDDVQRGFVNTWESIGDTYIVEHEHYGELSRYLDGNLRAAKLHAGVAFDAANKVRIDGIFAYYQTARPVQDSRVFGQEGDLTLTWKYTYDATIKLFAGGFLPAGAYDAVAPAGTQAGKDMVYVMGGSLGVVF